MSLYSYRDVSCFMFLKYVENDLVEWLAHRISSFRSQVQFPGGRKKLFYVVSALGVCDIIVVSLFVKRKHAYLVSEQRM